MSKSKILIAIGFSILVAATVFGALALQKHSVTISTPTPIELSKNGTVVATVENSTTLQLADGEYCAVAKDIQYSQDVQCFMVYKQNKEVALEIGLSKDNLAVKLDTEFNAIKSTVSSKYASIINQYTICRGELLGDGTWYGGILRDKVPAAGEDGNYYYYIARKDGDWKLLTTPTVAVSLHDPETKDIPEKIVRYVNTLTPCEVEVTDPQNTPANSVEPFETTKPSFIY